MLDIRRANYVLLKNGTPVRNHHVFVAGFDAADTRSAAQCVISNLVIATRSSDGEFDLHDVADPEAFHRSVPVHVKWGAPTKTGLVRTIDMEHVREINRLIPLAVGAGLSPDDLEPMMKRVAETIFAMEPGRESALHTELWLPHVAKLGVAHQIRAAVTTIGKDEAASTIEALTERVLEPQL